MQPNSSTSSPSKSRRKPSKAGFKPQQIAFLVLLGVLGAAVLGVIAFWALDAPPASLTSPTGVIQSPSPVATKLEPSVTPRVSTAGVTADCAKNGSAVQAGEARVVDGQTLEVTLGGKTVLVRFAGVAFRANNDDEISKAAAFLQAEMTDQPVLLVEDVTDRDTDGRLVRYVFAGSRFINDDLVRQGFARADYNAADRACIIPFQLSEQQARIDRLGIWQATPVPTATFIPLVTLDTSQQSCDCSKKYTCDDFKTHAAAQACFNACNDYSSKLDEDHNGIACENLP